MHSNPVVGWEHQQISTHKTLQNALIKRLRYVHPSHGIRCIQYVSNRSSGAALAPATLACAAFHPGRRGWFQKLVGRIARAPLRRQSAGAPEVHTHKAVHLQPQRHWQLEAVLEGHGARNGCQAPYAALFLRLQLPLRPVHAAGEEARLLRSSLSLQHPRCRRCLAAHVNTGGHLRAAGQVSLRTLPPVRSGPHAGICFALETSPSRQMQSYAGSRLKHIMIEESFIRMRR